MSKITICFKPRLNAKDCQAINGLKKLCIDEEDMFLKLELEYKLGLSQSDNAESADANEFFYYLNDILIGYLGIFSIGGQVAELTGMVHPLHRRKGVFKRLYSLARAECRRRNFQQTLLVCDNRSSSGLAFIKSTGAEYAVSEYEMRCTENYVSDEERDIVLRKATNLDADEIGRQNSIYFGITDRIVILPEEEEKRNRITYMIELASRVIGKIRVEFSADEGFISGFGILPEYRNKGYGRQALKATLALFNNYSIHNVALEVAAQNKNALSLYKSCGFAEESVTDYYEVRL